MFKTEFFSKNKSIVSFLALELIALLAFNFGDISLYISLAGVILAAVAFVFLLGITKNIKELKVLLIPLLVLFIISGIGSFNNFSSLFGGFSFQNLVLFLSIPSFFLLGFITRKLDDTKPYIVLLIIGAAFAAITLFGLISTLVEYGFFYSAIYKNKPYYYYNGAIFNVTEEMYWLNGFEFCEVSTQYGSLFAILSASFLPGLLFISYKDNRNEFLATLFIGLIGLLTLLIIPNFIAILILFIVLLLSLIYKFFSSNNRAVKITKIFILVLAGLALLFFVLALINAYIGFKFPGILNKVFVQNEIMQKCNPILQALFYKDKNGYSNLFGLKPLVTNERLIASDCGVFEVQLIMEIGLFGTILLLGFVVANIVLFGKNIKADNKDKHVNFVVLSMLFTFFIYESAFCTTSPIVHEDIKIMFLRSPIVLVVLFVLGFVYMKKDKTEGK